MILTSYKIKTRLWKTVIRIIGYLLFYNDYAYVSFIKEQMSCENVATVTAAATYN